MRFIFGFIFFLFLSVRANAQFLQIEIPVKSYLQTEIQQRLIVQNRRSGEGHYVIPLESAETGIYTVRSFQNQLIRVQISSVIFLHHINPAVKDSLMMKIKAAYNNQNAEKTWESNLFKDHSARFKIYDSGLHTEEKTKDESIWKTTYIYLFGKLNVGLVEPGLYTGKLKM
ncbi:MAG TPA: hypothetical protein VK106_07050, partial [Balneolaceae bacterium]|nr:hypothetical protein [Balneolaceae bacterium]